MKIAVISAGNIGGTLAKGWAANGHEVYVGVRDPQGDKAKKLTGIANLKLCSVAEAAAAAPVILLAAHPPATKDICTQLGDTQGKVIIDTMNSVFAKAEGFDSTFRALQAWTQAEVVKCFNSTGFENMLNPRYGDQAVEMFMAGSSARAKEIAKQLSLDLGFADCIDFGGDEEVGLLEDFARIWINLAFKQGLGRSFAIKLLKR